MLAIIRNRIHFRVAAVMMLACFATGLTSCATKDTALIADPNAKNETALPWNEQQQWEREGEAAMLNQQHRR
jgi:predicted ATPase